MSNRLRKNEGFVLIEMVIYIGLFSIMIGGLMVSAFQLMDTTTNNGYRTSTQAEVNFVLKKIDWALSGASNVVVSGSNKTLTVTNTNIVGSPLIFIYDDVNKKIIYEGEDLITTNVNVEELKFTDTGTTPKGVKVEISIDGQEASFSKYLRI